MAEGGQGLAGEGSPRRYHLGEVLGRQPLLDATANSLGPFSSSPCWPALCWEKWHAQPGTSEMFFSAAVAGLRLNTVKPGLGLGSVV